MLVCVSPRRRWKTAGAGTRSVTIIFLAVKLRPAIKYRESHTKSVAFFFAYLINLNLQIKEIINDARNNIPTRSGRLSLSVFEMGREAAAFSSGSDHKTVSGYWL